MNEKIRAAICDMGYEDAVVFDSPSYDEAIVGVTDDGRVVYDYDGIVRSLMREDGMSMDEAIEFVEYNTIRALPYIENPPIIMHRLATNS